MDSAIKNLFTEYWRTGTMQTFKAWLKVQVETNERSAPIQALLDVWEADGCPTWLPWVATQIDKFDDARANQK